MRVPDRSFWKGRRVLVTGHTGFKGSWLLLMLEELGALSSGFALPPEKGASAYAALGAGRSVAGWTGDIRDPGALRDVLAAARPEVVVHLAAQAIVSRAHAAPAETFSVNVGGTATLLEALVHQPGWTAALMVTSDKVYRNSGTGEPFREEDPLGGEDPYSASKAACELAVAAFTTTYGILGAVATARAGNVAGGGDFGEDRLLPDLLRAAQSGEVLRLRRPRATRPFQHVLDVLTGYLLHVEDLCRKPRATPTALNFGPEGPPLRVEEVVSTYCEAAGQRLPWVPEGSEALPEAEKLALDSGLARSTLCWTPRFTPAEAVADTARWHAAWRTGEDMAARSRRAAAEAVAR